MRAIYINLDRSPERRDWIESQAEDLDIGIERLSAVDGTLGKESIPGLSKGAWACFQSHRMAWQLVSDGDQPFGAIFEDDVHISPDLPRFLADPSWIPPDADIVHLGRSRERCIVINHAATAFDRKLYQTVSENSGTEAYIISQKCARNLLNEFTQTAEEFDIALFDKNSFGLTIYKMIPSLCVQDQFVKEPRFAGQIEHESKENQPGLQIGREVVRLASKLKRGLAKAFGLKAPVRIRVTYR